MELVHSIAKFFLEDHTPDLLVIRERPPKMPGALPQQLNFLFLSYLNSDLV